MAIILASKSPRRRELMARITPDFTVEAADFNEEGLTAPTPKQLALLLARGKCEAAARLHPGDVVIGCDTVVELDGQVLGKPHSPAEADAMLRALSGRENLVHTGVSVALPGGRTEHFTDTTRVWFSAIPQAEIDAYTATDEPYDKAGAYGIQGWASLFIPRIDGCFYNAMGFPVPRLYALLKQLEVL